MGEDGQRQLQELLQRSPADVANWMVHQAQGISSGVAVENLPIFQVAGAFSSVPVQQKQELMKSAISGFGQLPAEQRADVLRLAVTTAAASSSSGSGTSDPMLKNVGRLMKEAQLDKMPPEEKQQLAKEIKQDAAELVQPHQILEVVAELKPEEREHVTEALIEAKLVPEEQKTILEQAMRPGGYADKLAAAAKLWALAQEYSAVIVGLPFLELFIVLLFGGLPCQSGLSGWLRSDAIFSMVMIAGGWFCGLQLAPVFEELQRDPMTVAQRWQENQALPYQQRLEVLVPGVGISSYQLGGLGAALALIFLVLGLANTIVGLMELLGTVVMGCSAGLVIVSFFFLAVRCVTLAGILAAAKYVLTEIQVMGLDGYTSEDPLLRGNDPGLFHRSPLSQNP